jgi:hypothetical protein
VLPAFRNELQPWGIFGAKVRSGSIAIETAARVMSALPSIATELRTSQVVRLVPTTEVLSSRVAKRKSRPRWYLELPQGELRHPS